MKTVSLTPNELYAAWLLGIRRRIASVYGGWKDRNGCDKQTEAVKLFEDVNGAAGECAWAKATGNYWPMTVNVSKALPDVLPDFQVRTTPLETGHLIVREDDADSARFALVVGFGFEYRAVGCIKGILAKRTEWWRDEAGRGVPAYWVPQSELLWPVETISVPTAQTVEG